MLTKKVFPDRFLLPEKVALVTGAGRGIGAAISRALAEAGANLALVSRTEGELEAIKSDLEKLGCTVLTVTADITIPVEVAQLFNQVRNHFGKLDILVNNAGTCVQAKAEEMDLDVWDQIMRLNQRALFHCSQKAAQLMIPQNSGKIINIASHLGVIALPLRSAYGASKAAVVHLTRVLGAEWAQYHLNVNCIAPGFTLTKLSRKTLDKPDFREEVLSKTPLGFMAEPEDIAGAVLYLASDASRYMTGQTLVIDGGWSCL
jgi:NAD(P)-dependent dehydrogenase (short-subunit alcohol dehydrogenase family)